MGCAQGSAFGNQTTVRPEQQTYFTLFLIRVSSTLFPETGQMFVE